MLNIDILFPQIMMCNFLTDCRNFLGKTSKLIYFNYEFYVFMIMFLCVHDHVFSWMRGSVLRVSVYMYLCSSLHSNQINHYYVTGLSLYTPWKHLKTFLFSIMFFQKIRYSHPSSQLHTHIHTHTPFNVSSPQKVKCKGAFSFAEIVK